MNPWRTTSMMTIAVVAIACGADTLTRDDALRCVGRMGEVREAGRRLGIDAQLLEVVANAPLEGQARGTDALDVLAHDPGFAAACRATLDGA
jgi:hypothetical protein